MLISISDYFVRRNDQTSFHQYTLMKTPLGSRGTIYATAHLLADVRKIFWKLQEHRRYQKHVAI